MALGPCHLMSQATDTQAPSWGGLGPILLFCVLAGVPKRPLIHGHPGPRLSVLSSPPPPE